MTSSHMTATEKRNFAGGIWHGAFLALGNAFARPNTVLSSFVNLLTGSTVWVGGFSTLLTMAATLPQIFVARWIEPRPRKMPYLMLAIYLRVFSWGLLAWLIHTIGADNPRLLTGALFVLLSIFYAGGGLGNIPFTDIIGKVIPVSHRGRFFGGREALGAPLSIGAALLAQRILAERPYPDNYALLFGLAALSLGVASLGFWVMREPVGEERGGTVPPWGDYLRSLKEAALRIKVLAGVEILTGFSLMSLPFYVVYAQNVLDAPRAAVGLFLLVQVVGGILSNFVWAWAVDRYDSRRMLTGCALTSATVPLLAILLGRWGWQGLLPVFFLAGAIVSGRRVGFQTALLEMAPSEKRGTYAGLNSMLILPVAFLPLLAGVLLKGMSYPALFAMTAAVILSGGVLALRLPAKDAVGVS